MSLGISFRFRVHPDGQESFEVTSTSRDLSKWERLGGNRSTGSVAQDMKMSHLEEIAHIASQRHGKFDGNLHAFRESCDIDFLASDDPEGDADPTQPDR